MAVATRDLRISDDLALPLEAVTQALAILAKRGAGKTYTAGVWAEEVLEAGVQLVVLDPMGHWYGLRSSADGKGEGYPIPILGGDHGDVPLEPTAGVLVADLAVDERVSMVLDVSRFSKGERKRFVTDWLERLYARNRDPLHVILEEADLVAPQRYSQGEERMLGAVFDLVRRGRGRGLGSTLITQRSATLNNEVLEQTDILMVLRTTGPADRKAIARWTNVHEVEEERQAVDASLPKLPTGQAWVWWPEEEILQRVGIRAKRTFDSSATPKPGQQRVAPKTLADVDLAAFQKRMAETIERAKADDPKELRRRLQHQTVESARVIADLERQLAKRPTETKVETVEKFVHLIDVDMVRTVHLEIERIEQVGETLLSAAAQLSASLEAATGDLDLPGTPMKGRVAEAPRGVSGPARKSLEPHGQSVPVEPTATPPLVAARPAVEGEMRLGQAERTFLAALAQYPQGLSRTRLSLITGYSGKSGHFANVLGRLRAFELVERGDPIRITGAGVAAAGDYEPLPAPGEELIGYWLARLGKAESTFLTAFTGAYPASLARAELGEMTGYSPASGHFGNVLGRLRGLGLVDGWRASDELMGGT